VTKPLSLEIPVPIYLEVGSKKVFACSSHWPGWCRAAKTDDQAVEALTMYAERYRPVAQKAGMKFFGDPPTDFDVVERLKGNATTDFGAPGIVAEADRVKLGPAEAKRTADLVKACWQVLDEVVAQAPPKLKKGPRGGGRDRDEVFKHVLGAESAYGRAFGVRMPEPGAGDEKAIDALRTAIYDEIASAKAPGPKGWPARYAARRIAWHVLDHAWEIEDKSSG
jgi:hypothetical protein